MATVIGQSGAWGEIVSDLARRGFTVSTPQELLPLVAVLAEWRPQAISAHREYTMRAVQERSKRLAQLAADRGVIRRLLNWYEVHTVKTAVAKLYAADASYPALVDQNIRRIEALPNSAELAGAEAELKVIDQLRQLPDSCTVFNDVRLKATRHISFDGIALQSAQLDHVVLGPSGVFVVETKHWSRSFVASGDFHNPFDQSRRAGYLCFDLLRERFGKVKVRSVIASFGCLPSAPEGSQVKVLRAGELAGYLQRFNNVEIDPAQLEQLRAFFEARVPTSSRGT